MQPVIWLQISCFMWLRIRKSYQLCKIVHEIKILAPVDRLRASEPVQIPTYSADHPIISPPSGDGINESVIL